LHHGFVAVTLRTPQLKIAVCQCNGKTRLFAQTGQDHRIYAPTDGHNKAIVPTDWCDLLQ
jgi:hypothetical protein